LREALRANRKQLAGALAATTIDLTRVEMLQGAAAELASKRSQRITAALIEVARVLTPDQRAALSNRVERHRH
jgi:periplasmic protein CpxP/Spy